MPAPNMPAFEQIVIAFRRSPLSRLCLTVALVIGAASIGAAACAASGVQVPALDPGVSKRWLDLSADGASVEQPLPDAELRMLLRTAVETAIVRSPQLAQFRAEWEAARFDVDEAKGQRWPQIQVGATSQNVTFGGPNDNLPGNNRGALSVVATTPIFDWGRLGKIIESRSLLERAGELQWIAATEALASDVSSNLVEQGKNRAIAEVSGESVARIEALVKMLSDIVAVDHGRASELTQARARMLQAQTTRDAALARLRDLQLVLRKLVGERRIELPVQRAWELPTSALDSTLAVARDHPAIAQASAEANAATRNAEASHAAGLPQLNWVVSKTTQRDAYGVRQPWQTGFSITWAAFEGGAADAAEKAARRRAEARERHRDQLWQDTESQIRSAFQDADTLSARAVSFAELRVELACVRSAFFEQWYHLGRRTLLDVLQAENEYSANEVALYTSRFDGYQAALKMRAASGGLIRWLSNGLASRQSSPPQ